MHDLECEPSWKETWVAEALDGVLREAAARRLRSLALPILGAVYDRLPAKRSLELIGRAVERSAPECLERVWLIVPAGTEAAVVRALKSARESEDLPAEPLEHSAR